uniref:Intraflagellar transport protein 57 homolog n=1 Tax=Hirondellea gigas TaxID=1518452 RepID=A0A6A7G0A5_9CRUS
MSARRGTSGGEAPDMMKDDGDEGPGQNYLPFVRMEELLDKLKLLRYDKEFVMALRMKPLNRHYFALAGSPGEQFFLFVSLAVWLINKTGKGMEQPQESDDPNSVISNILDTLRQKDENIDFPPSKLKAGNGEHVIYVLDSLADFALKHTAFTWQKTVYPPEQEVEDQETEDEAELTLEKVEEEMQELYEDDDDEDEENIMHLDDLTDLTQTTGGQVERPEQIMHSNTTSEEWRLELERVLPQLRVTIRSDQRDWRSHIEQMHDYRSKIDESLSYAQKQLDSLHSEIAHSLEKVGSREKYINAELEQLLTEYRNLQNMATENQEQYRQVSGNLTQKSHELAQITDQLDHVKHEMEDRGSSMTDGTPLLSIRKALTRVKNELTAIDVRIGVVQQKLLMTRLKDKSNLQRDMNAPVHNNMDMGLY